MLIEIFFNELEFISSFRMNWRANCKNKPIQQNVYNINKQDFKKIVEFIMGGTAYITNRPPKIIGKVGKTSLHSGTLQLSKADYDDCAIIKENKKNTFLWNK